MSSSQGERSDLVSLIVPPGWHLASGLVVSFAFPIFGACVIAGALLNAEAFWWTAVGIFLIMFPFALGLELLARSSVKARDKSTKGWKGEIEIQDARIRMLSRAELESSMARLEMVDPGVFAARTVNWVFSALIVCGAVLAHFIR